MKKLFLTLFGIIMISAVDGQVVINELMTNNQNTAQDEDGEYSDWIEIYNGGLNGVSLTGYYLSDNPDSLTKWQFGNTFLDEDSFLIVWCSGKNHHNGELHTNFSIESHGETIYLSDASGNIIDNISAVYLPADKSYGRLPNGSGTFAYLDQSSFNISNNNAIAVTGLISEPPLFNIPGGFYTSAQNVSITHSDPTVTIHYTLDGSDPTVNSPVFTSPINIHSRTGDPNYYSNIRTCYKVHFYLPDWYPPMSEVFKCTVVRARAFKNGYFPSPIQTYSYFIDPDIFTRYGNLPVVSVVSDPKNLFNDTTGIYVPGILYQPNTFFANYYKDWDRPANIEMYMPGGTSAFNDNYKISINGQSSPSSPQKGLNVNASSDYGPVKIDYPLFQNTQGKAKYIKKFDKIKLRAWGSDRKQGLFRDAYCASFFHKTDLDYEAYQPVVVFIDGEYWGLQELRERNRNPEYYQSHYFIDTKNPGVDILNGSGDFVLYGDSIHWDAMMNFINSNSMAFQPNYDYVKTQMDVNSFILNFMSSIYFARGDWPDQNEAKWRPKYSGGKWKWIQWDMDNTVAYYLNPWYDMFPLVLNGSRGYGPSVLLVDLIQNNEFKTDFINLFADYMNTEFLPAIADAHLDKMHDELQPYMTEYMLRWQLNMNWQSQTDSMKWWMETRPSRLKQHIMTNFGSPAVWDLTLDVSDTAKGNIKVNTILLDENTTRTTATTYPWTGQYFQNFPVPLTAIAKPGYVFVKWLPSNDPNPTISVNLNSASSITAMFDIDPNYHAEKKPVINEVMASNTSTVADNYGEFDDWLEIYNPNNDTIDVGGYYLTDNLVLPSRFRIVAGTDSTKIPPHGFLMIWIDDDTEQGILHTSFKFSSSGDFIALVDTNGETVVDSISIPNSGADISWGRSYDASPQWITFSPSTPGSTNWTYTPDNILINELQTINVSTVQDNYGEYNQWIELFNPNNNPINVGGWKLSNGITSYTLPAGNDSTIIYPYSHKLLWADNDLVQGVLHLDFGLQQSGCVSLRKPNNALSDSECYNSLNVDQSWGRLADGLSTWIVFPVPTPDAMNELNVGLSVVSESNTLTIFPNPVNGKKIYFNHSISFRLYDALGKELMNVKNVSDADVSALEKGVYWLKEDGGEVVRLVRE